MNVHAEIGPAQAAESLLEQLIELQATNAAFRQTFQIQTTTLVFVNAYRSFVVALSSSSQIDQATIRILEKLSHFGLTLSLDESVQTTQKQEVCVPSSSLVAPFIILAGIDTRYLAFCGGCPQPSDVSTELYRPQRHSQPQITQQEDCFHETQCALRSESCSKINAKDLHLAQKDHSYRAKAIAQKHTRSVSMFSLVVQSAVYSHFIGANRGVKSLHLPNGLSRSQLSEGSGLDQMLSGSGA